MNRLHVIGDIERGVAASDRPRIQHLVRDVALQAGRERAFEDRGIGQRDIKAANPMKQFIPGLLSDLVPKFHCAQHERHVFRALVQTEAQDASGSVRASAGVWNRETFDAEHPLTRARELQAGGASHRANAQHGNVKGLHRGRFKIA